MRSYLSSNRLVVDGRNYLLKEAAVNVEDVRKLQILCERTDSVQAEHCDSNTHSSYTQKWSSLSLSLVQYTAAGGVHHQ